MRSLFLLIGILTTFFHGNFNATPKNNEKEVQFFTYKGFNPLPS